MGNNIVAKWFCGWLVLQLGTHKARYIKDI